MSIYVTIKRKTAGDAQYGFREIPSVLRKDGGDGLNELYVLPPQQAKIGYVCIFCADGVNELYNNQLEALAIETLVQSNVYLRVYNGLRPTNINAQADPNAFNIVDIDVQYGTPFVDDSVWTLDFNCSLENINVKRSPVFKGLVHANESGIFTDLTRVYSAQQDFLPTNGFVGITKDEITGFQMQTPTAVLSARCTFSKYHAVHQNYLTYVAMLSRCVGKVNKNAFWGFPPECMLLGSGTALNLTANMVTLNLQFIIQPSRVFPCLLLNRKTGEWVSVQVQKPGWRYVWFLLTECYQEGLQFGVMRMKAVHQIMVEPVYESLDFQLMLNAMQIQKNGMNDLSGVQLPYKN